MPLKIKHNNIIIIIILLIIVCLAVFGRIACNDFINLDDSEYVTENYQIQQGINLQSIEWAATAVVRGNWHPLTVLSHMLDWSLFGANPSGHHLVSLLLHIGAVIFLFLFLNKTTNNIWPSAFAAAFFALHPLRVESVAWASERKDVLSMFFGMACLYAYAFYAQRARVSLYILCLILFMLALMSKPMMVTLPFVLLLLDYWPLNRWQKALNGQGKGCNSIAGLIGEKVPFIVLTVTSSIITVWAQRKDELVSSMQNLPFFERFSHAVVAYSSYLGKIFWPFNLAIYYPYVLSLPVWKVLFSGIILICISLIVLYYIRKLPFLFVGWFIYLGTLIPVIGLVQVGSQAMADRYTYLPSIGIVIGLSWSIPILFSDKNTRKNILFPMGVAIIMFLSLITWNQCRYWKNTKVLFRHALNVTKNNHLAHNNLGDALFKEGRINEAFYHYNKAISIVPDLHGYYNNRANAYVSLGQYSQAMNDYAKAVSLKPDYTEAYYNRGTLYGKIGQYDQAIEDLNKTIALKPDHFKAFNNRGIVYNKIGLYKKSLEDFNEAIHLRSEYASAYNNKALLYLNMNNNVMGCENLRKACELGNCSTLQEIKKKGLCH